MTKLVETDGALIRRRECVDCKARLQDTVQSGREVLKYVFFPSLGNFIHNVGGSMFLWHVGTYLPDYTASRHKKTVHLFGHFVSSQGCLLINVWSRSPISPFCTQLVYSYRQSSNGSSALWFPESPAYGSKSCRVRCCLHTLTCESTESKRGERVAATGIVMAEQPALQRSGPCTQKCASQYTICFSSYHTSQMFVSSRIMQETVVTLCHPISSAIYVHMMQGSRTVAAEKGKVIIEGVCGG